MLHQFVVLTSLFRIDTIPHDKKMGKAIPISFLHLPPEIRLQIYEIALRDTKIVAFTHFPYQPPNLLLASKQIYSEAVEVFYTEATFYIAYSDQMERLLRAIRPYQNLVKCIRFGPNPFEIDDIDVLQEKFNQCKQVMQSLEVALNNGVLQIGIMIWSSYPWPRRSEIAWMSESRDEIEREVIMNAAGRFGTVGLYRLRKSS